MLKRRNYNINSTFECSMCDAHTEETVEHLFFYCQFSRQCWGNVGLTISDCTTMDRLQLIAHARGLWKEKMFMEIFATATWSIWKERNNFYFNGVTPDCNSWKSRFKEDFALLVHRTKEDKHVFIKHILSRF